MITKLNRNEVIKAIQLHRLLYLNIQEKGNILLGEGLENIGDEKEGWNEGEISKYEYNLLIIEQFQFSSLITNEYLELLMKDLYKVEVAIVSQQPKTENAAKCICCYYKIAFEKEDIDICPVCDWQDVYIENDESYSPANHSSLKDYRENFQQHYTEDIKNLKYKKFSK